MKMILRGATYLLIRISDVFGVAIICSYFSPARTRRLPGGRRSWLGSILAALF